MKEKLTISPEKQKEWTESLKKVKEKITIKPEKDWAEELKKAKELLDAGILSEEEFASLKTKVLEKF